MIIQTKEEVDANQEWTHPKSYSHVSSRHDGGQRMCATGDIARKVKTDILAPLDVGERFHEDGRTC